MTRLKVITLRIAHPDSEKEIKLLITFARYSFPKNQLSLRGISPEAISTNYSYF